MSPRLSIIPAGAVTDPSLEPRDLQVLCLLGRHTDKDSGWCRRSQVKMAREISCGRATLQRSLERLVDAGWVQKRQWNVPEGVEPGQPSASYLYRVILDRDDFVDAEMGDEGDEAAAESHASDASIPGEGVPTGGHPARLDGHGVPTHARAPRTSLTNVEGERDARARDLRDRKARFIVAFEQRWPTSAADDRQRTAYAGEALTETEEQACLDGIGPFLDELKRHKRKHVPAGWKFIEERRWTLLPQKAVDAPMAGFPSGGEEARALAVLHQIAGKYDYFQKVMVREGKVYWRGVMAPRLLALARAGHSDTWPQLDHRQAAAWEDLLREHVKVQARSHMVAGLRAPWPWPPSVEGKLYTQDTGPPMIPPLTDDDCEALANEGMR